MSAERSGESQDLSFWMRAALRRLSEHGRMVVGWKNTPYIAASGTAEALVKRGLARYTATIEDLARGGSQRITITDEGRKVRLAMDGVSDSGRTQDVH